MQRAAADTAVGEVDSGMTGCATESLERRAPGKRCGRHAAVDVARRAARQCGAAERAHIRRQSVEIGGTPGLGCTERGAGGSEIGIAQKSAAAEGVAHVVLEILDLIEVGAPVN